MEKKKPKITSRSLVLSIIAIIILFALYVVSEKPDAFIPTLLRLKIDIKSTVSYKSEQLHGGSKSMLISPDPFVCLGYGYEDEKLHFCVHGIKEVEAEYTRIGGTYKYSHRLKILSEIVFAKDELEEGGRISGLSMIFVDNFQYYSGYYEFRIEIKNYTPYNVIVTYRIEEGYLTDYDTGLIENYARIHIREIFKEFHVFLVENNYRGLYR